MAPRSRSNASTQATKNGGGGAGGGVGVDGDGGHQSSSSLYPHHGGGGGGAGVAGGSASLPLHLGMNGGGGGLRGPQQRLFPSSSSSSSSPPPPSSLPPPLLIQRPPPQSSLEGRTFTTTPSAVAAAGAGRYTSPILQQTLPTHTGGGMMGNFRRNKQTKKGKGGIAITIRMGLVLFLGSLSLAVAFLSVVTLHMVDERREEAATGGDNGGVRGEGLSPLSTRSDRSRPSLVPSSSEVDVVRAGGATTTEGSKKRKTKGGLSVVAIPAPPPRIYYYVVDDDSSATNFGVGVEGNKAPPSILDKNDPPPPPAMQPGDNVVAVNNEQGYHYHPSKTFQPDPLLHVKPGEEAQAQQYRKPYIEGDCIPMSSWQIDSKPNCNTVHELDMIAHERRTDDDKIVGGVGRKAMKFLAQGWFRDAWKVYLADNNNINGGVGDTGKKKGGEEVILKTLRIERAFYDEYYDLHRRDAMAMERLTFSPHILDVYGYCGQTALNEVAADNIERVAMRYKNKKPSSGLNQKKLHLANAVASGVADIHEVDYKSSSEIVADNATMVHYDLNPRNVAIMADGSLKLNDFNVAEFLRWNVTSNEQCGFKGRLYEPWWRAPEEMATPDAEEAAEKSLRHADVYLNEKVDVYSLGNILFRILTGMAPRGKSITSRVKAMRQELISGKIPDLPNEWYAKTDEPHIKAIRTAMVACYEPDPTKRPPARDIADYLSGAIEQLKAEDTYDLGRWINDPD